MKDLAVIDLKQDRITVSARELHEFLEIGVSFPHWFERMKKYGFTEGIDFWSFLTESTGGRPATDAQLTIDMAKELCMLQRNERGKQARQYFINIEKEWNSPDKMIARSLLMAKDRIDELESVVEDQRQTINSLLASQPPLFMPTITEATLNIRDSAKEIGVPQKKFVAFLEEHHYVTRDEFGHMIPDSKYVKNHYFELRHYNINGIHVQPLLTCKGRKHLMKMMIRNNTKERALAC